MTDPAVTELPSVIDPTPKRIKPNILIVEDNFANALLMQFTLTAAGAEIEVASNAREAIASVNNRRPHLILMDIQLPDQDGLSLTRQFKSSPLTASIPIVAVTARTMVGDREVCLEAGCSSYIPKPIDVRTFASQLAPFLPHAKTA
jgi:two-component system cell cycle response regulator DivK